ncbi:MAG TPA: DEDD exonuclease domain-containing protein [Nitriliruptorales bacterium]|nr:DEDD exonuclease domain-containing protein [Nitriliruptorales bacterium]
MSHLTGIDDRLVADCPPLEAVLPALLEFLRGTTLVAHNAHFDVSFLQAALRRLDYPLLDHVVIDTARLARRVLPRDEVRDCRLTTLARHLRARVQPEHRALPDARATVDVLHGLLERVGNLGVTTLEDVRDYTRSRSDTTYRKIRLVRHAPDAPGVYRFHDRDGRVLYVGKAANLRARLRRYFGQDPRRMEADLVRQTAQVTWDVTPTELEAAVAEVRAMHLHRPRHNRRSRAPRPGVYVTLTRERFPRLSIVAAPRDGRFLPVGPFPHRAAAERFVEAVHDALPLRRCADRLTSRRSRAACVLKDLGRCGAPCDGTQDETSYATVVERYRTAVTADPTPLITALRRSMRSEARQESFERAQRIRGHLHHLAAVLADRRRTAALVAVEELAAVRARGGRRQVALVRRGRLAGSVSLPGSGPGGLGPAVDRLRAVAPPTPAPGHPTADEMEEVRLVMAWLAGPGTRLLSVRGVYAEPVAGGTLLHRTLDEARRAGRGVRRDRDVAIGRKAVRRAG